MSVYVIRDGKLVDRATAPPLPNRCDRRKHWANPRPPFPSGHSPIHGRDLASWSDYHKANRELGLVDVGIKPDKDPPPKFEHVSFDDVPSARVEMGDTDE